MNLRAIRLSRNSLISIILVGNVFVWYYFVSNTLQLIASTYLTDQNTVLLFWLLHLIGIVSSAIFGALWTKRIQNRTNFLILWMIIGVIASLILASISFNSIPSLLGISLFLGVSLGLGMPSCMGFFTESVKIENRGSIGGVILLVSGVGMVILGTIAGGNLVSRTLILVIWRLFGLISFLPFRKLGKFEPKQAVSYREVLSQKSFILYLTPWIIFSLINYLTTPIQAEVIGNNTLTLLIFLENGIVAIFAIIGGYLLDLFGRKRMAITGFVLLGLGQAMLGLGDPHNIISWYFYTVADGIAWGLLFVIFVISIWGDLSANFQSEKFYAIGVMPFFISQFLALTVGKQLALAIPAASIFSFTALFLFLAVLPLFYAPETLPEKLMKDRELKGYIEKAQKAKEKYS